MKVLYAAMYNDPTDPMAASGVDYNFFTQIKKHVDEVRVAGPFRVEGLWPERALKRLYMRATGKRYMKWNLRAIWRATQEITWHVQEWQPDLVFSMFPANLAFLHSSVPIVFATDLSFRTWQLHGANFGRLAFWFQLWLEKRAVHKNGRVIVSSHQLQADLVRYYGLSPQKIAVIPMPAALPGHIVPSFIDVRQDKQLVTPIRLLLVGREYYRKGIDVAIQIVELLNQQGLQASLTICASQGEPAPYVNYVGSFNKKDPAQLAAYSSLYRQAHFLVHPARFDPSPIVTAEAAAYATPTVTNNVGGIATSVADGVSGIVLPEGSSADAYVAVIQQLVRNPERYYALCATTRQRYERELNWDVAGLQVKQVLEQVVAENRGRQ